MTKKTPETATRVANESAEPEGPITDAMLREMEQAPTLAAVKPGQYANGHAVAKTAAELLAEEWSIFGPDGELKPMPAEAVDVR